MKKVWMVLSVIVCFSVLSLFIPSCCQDEKLVGSINDFIAAMQAENMLVQEGLMQNVEIILDCCDPAKPLPMCYGNNPNAPYLVAYLPEAEGQLIRNMPINYLNYETCPNGQLCPGKMSRSYRFGANEAIVIVGRTPPEESVYYSYIPYLSLRYSGDGAYPPYHRLFASMSDALNNHTIWTDGTPGGNSGISFDRETVIIVTADETTERSIRSAATEAGYSEKIINTLVIPSQIVNLGTEWKRDEVAILHRCAVRDDAYIANPPVRVFRVSSQSLLNPLPAPVFTPRGSGTSEYHLAPAVAALRQKILETYAPGKSVQEYTAGIWVPEGTECISRGIDCLGDNHDALYLRIPEGGGTPLSQGKTFSLDDNPEDFIIVYGTNHTATGKTLYHSVSNYRFAMLNGVGTLWDNEFKGSADRFLRDTAFAGDAKYLYLLRIARRFPSEVNEPCLPFPDAFGLPANAKESCRTAGKDDLLIAVRAYLEKATGVGPSYNEIIWDRAIHFR